MSEEINLDSGPTVYGPVQEALADAIDAASDQDKITYIRDGGRRIAAIVPVDVAEEHERQIEITIAVLTGKAGQCLAAPHEAHTLSTGEACGGVPEGHRPVNRWAEAPGCNLLGHAQHEASGIIYRPGDDGLMIAPGAASHAHWVGDREAGHRAFMQVASGLLNREKVDG